VAVCAYPHIRAVYQVAGGAWPRGTELSLIGGNILTVAIGADGTAVTAWLKCRSERCRHVVVKASVHPG